MKIQKLALAGLLALASAVSSFGTTTIHIIGSTAYRAAVNDAIRHVLNSGYTWAISAGSTSDSALAGASAGWWKGTLKSTSAAVEIKTFFTGSIAGAVDISIPHTVKGFIPDTMNDGSQTGSTSGVAVASGALVTSTEYTAETDTPDFAWTDTNQTTDALVCQHATSSTAYNDTVGAGLTEAGTLAPSVNAQGIVFFDLILEKLSSGSNPIPQGLSSDNLCTMITQGYISVAQVTGTTTGNGTTSDIFLIGRNEDSGSRGNVFTDAFEGYNIGSKINIQFLPNYTGSPASYTDSGAPNSYTNAASTVITGGTVYDGGTAGTLAGLIEWPKNWALNTDSTIEWNTTGHSGFISGGEVASALSAPDPVTGITVNIAGSTYTPSATYVVGYVGGTDAATATGNGAIALPYNGVSYSYNNVINGTYGLWGMEHAYYLTSEVGTDLAQGCNDISDYVYTYSAEDSPSLVQSDTGLDAAGIFMGVMTQVNRGSPGAPILESYNP
jgi:hypothetical protein